MLIHSHHERVRNIDRPLQFIQDDFVKERRASATMGHDEKKEPVITSDDLVHWMITARLVKFSRDLECKRSF